MVVSWFVLFFWYEMFLFYVEVYITKLSITNQIKWKPTNKVIEKHMNYLCTNSTNIFIIAIILINIIITIIIIIIVFVYNNLNFWQMWKLTSARLM